jgi:hypothetical protein
VFHFWTHHSRALQPPIKARQRPRRSVRAADGFGRDGVAHRDEHRRAFYPRGGKNEAGHPVQIIGIDGDSTDVEVRGPGDADDLGYVSQVAGDLLETMLIDDRSDEGCKG